MIAQTLISDWTFQFVGLSLIILGAIPSTAFAVYYGLRAKWWRSSEGVNLFGFTTTIALMLDFTLLVRFTGEFVGLRVIALVLYASIAGFMAHRLALLIRARRLKPGRRCTDPQHRSRRKGWRKGRPVDDLAARRDR